MNEITSQSNGKLKELTLLCRDRSERDLQGLCILDGLKLCRDAVENGSKILQLWISESSTEKYREALETVIAASEEVYVVSDSAAKKLSETVSPQGVIALLKRPLDTDLYELASSDRILGLCGVQNPENIGAAIRSAAAFGFSGIMISRDCADPWSPRSVRAGAGTQLNCMIYTSHDFAGDVRKLGEEGFRTLASALHRDSVPLIDEKTTGKIFLAVGSEGSGLPEEVIEACSETVYIPLSEGVESLNAAAAAAVMMWELRKK